MNVTVLIIEKKNVSFVGTKCCIFASHRVIFAPAGVFLLPAELVNRELRNETFE